MPLLPETICAIDINVVLALVFISGVNARRVETMRQTLGHTMVRIRVWARCEATIIDESSSMR
jgi:hypothetical protein